MGLLDDAGGSGRGFSIFILTWMWLVVFEAPLFPILALYLDFECANNIHVLYVLIWDSGGCWKFLIGVLHLDLDLDMVMGLGFCFVILALALIFALAKISAQ